MRAGHQDVDGLDDGADAASGASGAAEKPPGLQLREGTFSGISQSGVIAVELLVVLRLIAVVAAGGANGGARRPDRPGPRAQGVAGQEGDQRRCMRKRFD